MTLFASPAVIGFDRIIRMDAVMPTDINTVDKFNAVQAALLAGEGREVVFNSKIGAVRTYAFTQRFGRLVMPKRSRIIMDPGVKCDFSAWSIAAEQVSSSMFYAEGVFTPIAVTGGTLAVPPTVVAGTRTLYVADGTLFRRGMRFVLNTTELYTPMDDTLGVKGEWCVVREVSGNTITVVSEFQYSYPLTGNTVVAHLGTDLVNLKLENFTIIGPGLKATARERGDRGIEVLNADKLIIEGGDIRDSDAHSVLANTVRHLSVRGLSCTKTQDVPAPVEGVVDDRIRYNISIAGCAQHSEVVGCSIEGGTELISPTLSGGVLGLKEHIRITGNTLRGALRSGVATHHAYKFMQVDHNKFYDCNQGADFRLGGKFNDNVVRNMGAGLGNLNTAVQLGSGFDDFFASDNDIQDVLRGYWLPTFEDPTIPANGGHWRVPPGDVTIVGDCMRNVAGHGVLLEYFGTPGFANKSATLGALTIQADIGLVSTGTPRAVQTHGKWLNPYIDVTVRGGTGTGRTVYQTRTNGSVLTTDGPVNPIIKTRRASPLLGALIEHPANGAPSVSVSEAVFGTP